MGKIGSLTAGGAQTKARGEDPEGDLGKGLNQQAAGRLARYLLPYRVQISIAIGAVFMRVLGVLALPRLLGFAIDAGIQRANPRMLLLAVVAYFLANVVVFAMRILQDTLTNRAGNRVIFDLRFDLFKHMQVLGLKFHDRMGVGRLMSRIQGDVSVLNDLLTDGIVGLFSDMFVLVGVIIAMLTIDVRLALLMYTVIPLMVGVLLVWRRFAIPVYRSVRLASSRLTGYAAENISGMKVSQSFRREAANYARFEEFNSNLYRHSQHSVWLNSSLQPSVELINGLALIMLLLVGGRFVIAGTLSVGALIAFYSYISRFFQPVRALSERYNSIQSATIAAERVFELLDAAPDVTDRPDATVLPPVVGEVRFEHVTFGYADKPVLRDIDLVIQPGQTVAFVGPTGAGKSSTINLVPRFYDVWEGRVTIDGHDVRDVTLESLREQIGIVLQDPFLFSGTIAENIRYGRLDATDDEVEQAARAVGAHDFVSRLGEGYEMHVQERGGGLSIGQRQLIAFARAVLADRPVLILDEATSSVDTQTEQTIQYALRNVLKGRTSLVIAHRLSTVVDADQIVVINAGQIIERGTHNELLALGGTYHKLYTTAIQQAENLETATLES